MPSRSGVLPPSVTISGAIRPGNRGPERIGNTAPDPMFGRPGSRLGKR